MPHNIFHTKTTSIIFLKNKQTKNNTGKSPKLALIISSADTLHGLFLIKNNIRSSVEYYTHIHVHLSDNFECADYDGA